MVSNPSSPSISSSSLLTKPHDARYNGNRIGLTSEGYDVINFGSSKAKGSTQLTVGGGFRSRLLDNVDLGIAYEKAVVAPNGLTDDRFTVDFCIRF